MSHLSIVVLSGAMVVGWRRQSCGTRSRPSERAAAIGSCRPGSPARACRSRSSGRVVLVRSNDERLDGLVCLGSSESTAVLRLRHHWATAILSNPRRCRSSCFSPRSIDPSLPTRRRTCMNESGSGRACAKVLPIRSTMRPASTAAVSRAIRRTLRADTSELNIPSEPSFRRACPRGSAAGGSRAPNSPPVMQPSVSAGLRRGPGAASACVAATGDSETGYASPSRLRCRRGERRGPSFGGRAGRRERATSG